MTEASPIPPPRSDDDEDVHWALSTASALWARGDTGEALKWLRRAAETASDQNRDQRSLELFKAAADATSLLGGRGSGSVPAPPGHAPGNQPAHGMASNPPPGAAASHPPPRTSGTPPPPRAATPPPPRVSATPPPPRVSAPPPSASTPPPIGSAAPPPRVSATPPPPQVGAAARPSALPSASTPRPPGALPAPVAAARAVLKGKEATSQRPSGAVARKRKNTLDERFQFPDDEVTQQRDMRSLDRSRPAVQPPAPPVDDAAAVSAMAPTAPVPATGASAGPASGRGASAASRTASSAASRAQPSSGLRATASSGTASSGSASSGAGAGPVHATTTRTILSAGMSARPSGVQPAGSAAAAAARAMSRQPTRKIDTTPPPMDDLDEQTSVLSGDEAELDFDGSATGENPVEDPRTVHDEPPDGGPSDAAREATPEPTPGASATDEPLYAPSIRPQPMGEVATGTGAPLGAAAWPTMRVALRRDAGGVRIEALGIHAATPPGATAALLVAHDPASAEALAKLLEPR